MPAYVDQTVRDFLGTPNERVLANLHGAYAADGFVSQYTSQTFAWENTLDPLKDALQTAAARHPSIREWTVLLELPLYRLRRRIDLIVITQKALAVIELKVGETKFVSTDVRQVEEYALDLRDFHEYCQGVPIVPALWSTEANSNMPCLPPVQPGVAQPVVEI